VALGEKFENWIYGCDICQDICPWNEKFSLESANTRFAPRHGNVDPNLQEWKDMTQEEFPAHSKGARSSEPSENGLVRNVQVVLSVKERQKEDSTDP